MIIGTGSIVTKSFGDNVIIAGNPAKIVGYVDDYKKRMQNYNMGSNKLNRSDKKAFLLSAEEKMFVQKPYLKKN